MSHWTVKRSKLPQIMVNAVQNVSESHHKAEKLRSKAVKFFKSEIFRAIP
jgi:hypothetical protein